jgi:hypothetical protein
MLKVYQTDNVLETEVRCVEVWRLELDALELARKLSQHFAQEPACRA